MICALDLEDKIFINDFSLYCGLCLVSCSLFDFQKTKLLQFTTMVCFLQLMTLIQCHIRSVCSQVATLEFEKSRD